MVAAPDGSLLIGTYWGGIHRLAANRSVPVNMASTAPSIVNGDFTVTITFDQPVTGFDVSDISLSANASAGTFTAVDSETYTLVVQPTADGEVVVQVAADAATDTVGFTSLAQARIVPHG